MYKEIKMNLKEMSSDRNRLIQNIIDKTHIINEHLLKCLLIQNKSKNLNHWTNEIYSFLHEVPKLKGKNKLPNEKFLTTYTIGYFGDVLYDRLDVYISNINYSEKTSIKNYNKQALYDCIIDYYKWLIPILSKDGIVALSLVKQEINNLIQKYNQLNCLFEMSNLKANRTNLKADLWVEEKGEDIQKKDKEPRVKISTINHGRFPISISDNPTPLDSTDGFKKEDLDIINNAKPYIKRNKDVLLQFYKGKIDIDDLLDVLSERGDYKRNKDKKGGT